MDPKDRKKIQFSVPAPPGQLDPRAVDMIRRRRPTPAMLFQMSEHSSPGESRTLGEGHLLKTKRTTPCVYTPPSLKGTCAFISSFAKRKPGSSSEIHPCAERQCKVYASPMSHFTHKVYVSLKSCSIPMGCVAFSLPSAQQRVPSSLTHLLVDRHLTGLPSAWGQ
uniref:Protein phosphatase 1 regulatory subunit 1B n=1 Tax=Gopherus evgoodei TaxID=1825980 RepID=A0A8C4Y4X1_9SAUR